MSRLIFVNKNLYDIFVPTPNGAGRRIKVGQAVEGDYFIDIANTGQLQRFMGDPNSVEIICNYRLNSYLKASQSSAASLKAEDAPSVVVEEAVAPVVEAPVVESNPLTPSEKDLYGLSMDELRTVAGTMGIDAGPDVKKKKLIAMINTKNGK